MSEEVKGVFVRLPLSEAQINAADSLAKEIAENNTENEWRFARHHSSACEELICSIGTPVTHEELYPVGYINEDAIGGLATGIYQSASIFRDEDKEHHDTVALARLGVAEAQIAALEAEVKEEQRISNLRADAVDRWTNSCAQQDEIIDGLRAEIARLQAKQTLYDRVIQENGELKLAVARLQKPEFYGTEGQDTGSDDVSSLFDFCENNEVIEVNGYRCVSTQFGFFDGIDVHLYNSEAEAETAIRNLGDAP